MKTKLSRSLQIKAYIILKQSFLALGNGSFQPRKLNLDNAETFENHGLDYFVNDLMKYALEKKLLLLEAAILPIDWALMLEPIASEVYLIHRRPNSVRMNIAVSRLKSSSVNLLTPYLIDGLSGNDGELFDIRLKK